VAIHPPLLYIGFVGFTVPFAFAIGMLATGRIGDRWQIECRRWTLVSFTFLSVGIVLGAWWSYQVLGWGGFWGWDPVENAALLPWLCGTAYLHSVLVQERRGLMRVWNLSLSVATFALTILGDLPDPLRRHQVGARLLGIDARAHPHRVLLRWWSWSASGSSPGGATACALRAASTPPWAARVPSSSTTCSSSASPSSSCWAPCTRFSTRP
jgi:MFS family permease